MLEYKDRLAVAMKHAGATVSSLAAELGTSYQAVKHVVDGKNAGFGLKNNVKAAAFLDVNSDWLATGQGAMRNAVAATQAASLAPSPPASPEPVALSPMANALAQLFDMLPSDAVTRTRAYNRATEQILRVLQGIEDRPTHTPETSDPAQTPPARRTEAARS